MPRLIQIDHRYTEDRRFGQCSLYRGQATREAGRNLKRRISDRIWTHLNTHSLT